MHLTSNNKQTMRSKLWTKLRSNKSYKRISWRPSLHIIYKDEFILNALLRFAEQSFNAENILFLLLIKELRNAKLHQINEMIEIIYNYYIKSGAEYQVNISSSCYGHLMCQYPYFESFSLDQKRSMFNHCFEEIETLVNSSILPSFYWSNTFRQTVKKSTYYKAYKCKTKTSSSTNKWRSMF